MRVMPNTPVLVRNGASAFVCGSSIEPEDEAITRRMLEAVGTCEKVPESLMDTVTALSGSGPAYVSNNALSCLQNLGTHVYQLFLLNS